MAPWPMKSWTSYWPSLVPVPIDTGPDYGVTFARLSPRQLMLGLLPASTPVPSNSDQPGQDGERNLTRSGRADIEADRALDARDHRVIDAFGPQGFQVMAGVTAASDQAEEAGVLGQECLQRPHQVGGVVVGVHGINVRTERRLEVFQIDDRLGPVPTCQTLRPRLDQHWPETHLRPPPQQRFRNRSGAEHDQRRCRGVWLKVDLDRAELVAVGPELGRRRVRDAARLLEGGGVELAAAEGASKGGGSGEQ